jgi:hypothetical protein
VGLTRGKMRMFLAPNIQQFWRSDPMLWTIIVVLFILWILGFSLHIGGGLIHIILVIAVIILIFNLLSGRRGI